MSTQKVPVSLIQVLDAEGKVTNYEIEYIITYVGDDPNIARNFKPSRDREEVTADEFAAIEATSSTTLTKEVRALSDQIAAMQEQERQLHAAHAKFGTETANTITALEAQLRAAPSAEELAAAKERNDLLEDAISKAAKVLDNANAAVLDRDERIAAQEKTIRSLDTTVGTLHQQVQNLNALVAQLRGEA